MDNRRSPESLSNYKAKSVSLVVRTSSSIRNCHAPRHQNGKEENRQEQIYQGLLTSELKAPSEYEDPLTSRESQGRDARGRQSVRRADPSWQEQREAWNES
jgi:hypothetical protein